MLYLTNTISRQKEAFHPIDERCVRMYACGPTVYERPHLGNARAAVIYDLLFRLLKHLYPNVVYVRNITDVDDKIIKAALENQESIASLTKRITEYYHQDIAALNCLPPTHEPRATEHIPHMIAMIELLIKHGNAYVANDHVLFDTQSYNNYGALSHRNADELIAGARVEVAPYKKNPTDFVLWKPVAVGEEFSGFESPWGLGRPGWHIECSAMSKELLGETFDIHGGGADLMFPHHENEIAQSCCANKTTQMANFWIHNGFLTVNGEKMSKSLGNFFTVREVLDKGILSSSLRIMYLSTHYRKPLDYNEKAVQDAALTAEKFAKLIEGIEPTNKIPESIISALCDDLNTPKMFAEMHGLAARAKSGDKIAASELAASLQLIGIKLQNEKKTIPDFVTTLAEQRMQAKLGKDWQKADKIRQEINALGFDIKDSKDGYQIEAL
jgi:cysteinyl-tRNA synthetase